MTTLSLAELDALNSQQQELEKLKEQVELLKWEREIIRARVYGKIRDLVWENEELKKRISELEANPRPFATSKRSSTDIPLTPSSSRATPPPEDPSDIKSSSEKKASWKDKFATSIRKQTTRIFGGTTEYDTSQDETQEVEYTSEASNQAIVPSPPSEVQIVFEDADDILFMKTDVGKMPDVKAATPEKLLEKLVPEQYPDPNYLSHFLLTYRSFTTPEKILDYLTTKFRTEPLSEDMTIEQLESVRKTHQVLKIRVVNAIKTWLGHKHSYDLEENATMISKIGSFIVEIKESGMIQQAEMLRNLLEKLSQKTNFLPSIAPPKPILGPNPIGAPASINLLDIDPQEMARQITLLEYDLFKEILPKECLGQAWTKKEKEVKSPHVLRMIHWSNEVSWWVTTEVLKRDSPKLRSDVLKYFIKLAKYCKDLNNFNAVFEILAALQSSAVDRLKRTWEKLERVVKVMHLELTGVTSRDKNFKNLRDHLKKSLPPCIPYLGMFLTDLTFIDQGIPDRLKSEKIQDGLINFDKLRQTAIVIKQIQLFQQTGYGLEPVKEIREYLTTVKERNVEEEEAYKLSLLLEPRETTQ